eukprot:4283997-Prymnesium_polylepis.1
MCIRDSTTPPHPAPPACPARTARSARPSSMWRTLAARACGTRASDLLFSTCVGITRTSRVCST